MVFYVNSNGCGKHFEEITKVDTSKIHLSKSGEVVSEENTIPKECIQT